MNLCKYKHVFGEEGTGVHSLRLFNLAVADVMGTIVIALALAWWMQLTLTNTVLFICIVFLIAILVHRAFCVNTTINKMIFGTV